MWDKTHNDRPERFKQQDKFNCADGYVYMKYYRLQHREEMRKGVQGDTGVAKCMPKKTGGDFLEAHTTGFAAGKKVYWAGRCLDCRGRCGTKACRKINDWLPVGFKAGDPVPCEPCPECVGK